MGILAGFMVPHPPLIVPEVGRGQEKEIQRTINAYQGAARRIGSLQPETIVLISPHQVMYADYFHISPGKGAKGDFGQFRAGGVKTEVSYDTEFVKALCRMEGVRKLPGGCEGEKDGRLDHGTMVPLYFVDKYWTQYRLVRIGLSGLSFARHYELGEYISKAARELGRRTVVIASGDLSHRLKEGGPYGYQKEGLDYDRRLMDVMERAAFGELFDFPEAFCEKAGECGTAPSLSWQGRWIKSRFWRNACPMRGLLGWAMASALTRCAVRNLSGISGNSTKRWKENAF